MLDSLNAAASGMMAQQKQIDTISNNIANADTVSFKKSRAEFQDLLYQNVKAPGSATSATTQSPTGIQIGRGVKLAAVSRELQQGSPRTTGRDTDFMINGQGYFSVQRPDGELAFTRDGSFHIGAEGRVENADGFPVVPEITVPREAAAISVAPDGVVRARLSEGAEQEIGQIQVTTFANAAGLQAVGGNLFVATEASGAPVPGNPGEPGIGRIMQGVLESSNVTPVTEMTDMIRAQRTYELNSKVINSTDQMMNTLNSIR